MTLGFSSLVPWERWVLLPHSFWKPLSVALWNFLKDELPSIQVNTWGRPSAHLQGALSVRCPSEEHQCSGALSCKPAAFISLTLSSVSSTQGVGWVPLHSSFLHQRPETPDQPLLGQPQGLASFVSCHSIRSLSFFVWWPVFWNHCLFFGYLTWEGKLVALSWPEDEVICYNKWISLSILQGLFWKYYFTCQEKKFTCEEYLWLWA